MARYKLAIFDLAGTTVKNPANIGKYLQGATDVESDELNIEEIPGTTKTFRVLKEMGIKIAILSGFDRRTKDILFDQLNWGDLVDDSITGEDLGDTHSTADMILELCRRAGVTPDETVKLSDTPADLQEGANARVGLNIGVTYGTHTEAQLQPFGPDALLSEIGDLLRLDL